MYLKSIQLLYTCVFVNGWTIRVKHFECSSKLFVKHYTSEDHLHLHYNILKCSLFWCGSGESNHNTSIPLGEDLYYWRYKGTPQASKVKVLCGAQEAGHIFQDFHDSPTGAHLGQKKTREAISLRFYWPGMSVDINKLVS